MICCFSWNLTVVSLPGCDVLSCSCDLNLSHSKYVMSLCILWEKPPFFLHIQHVLRHSGTSSTAVWLVTTDPIHQTELLLSGLIVQDEFYDDFNEFPPPHTTKLFGTSERQLKGKAVLILTFGGIDILQILYSGTRMSSKTRLPFSILFNIPDLGCIGTITYYPILEHSCICGWKYTFSNSVKYVRLVARRLHPQPFHVNPNLPDAMNDVSFSTMRYSLFDINYINMHKHYLYMICILMFLFSSIWSLDMPLITCLDTCLDSQLYQSL